MSRVALVVAADEGIGPNIARRLCERFDGRIYITGQGEACRRLANELGPDVQFHQLDITSVDSLIKLRTDIQDIEEGIDLIINNGATAEAYGGSVPEQIRKSLDDHFYGMVNFGNLLFPLLTEGARVVTVNSSRGLLAQLPGEDVRMRFDDPNITEDDLVLAIQEYEEAGRRGTERIEGWGSKPAVVGKVSLSALIYIQNRDKIRSGISVCCVNPGDGISKRRKAKEEAAMTVLHVALNADNIGGNFFWCDRKVVNWRTFIETHL